MSETNISISYTAGMTINMDACSMLPFLQSLAISTIAECRTMKNKENMGTLESTSDIPFYDELVENYCSGVHGAVLSNMLNQNIKILYGFVRECVLNETVKGLYLLCNKPRNGDPTWKLIILALSEYSTLVQKEYDMIGKAYPPNATKWDEYNERFSQLME